MSFLLDTNVIAEGGKPRPDTGVMDWLASMDEELLFLSVISLAELRHGIERMGKGVRQAGLDIWLTEQLAPRFEDRLLSIDGVTADLWGRIVARAQGEGRPIGVVEAFVAAHAQQHELTLVTCNIFDFEATGIRLFNPWTEVNLM